MSRRATASAPELDLRDDSTRSLQRIFRAQLDEALASLSRKRVTDEQIHEARKQLKKARATLRLLRNALGKTVYARENAVLRDAARPLGNVRDAHVLPETLDELVARDGRPGRASSLEPLRDALNRALMQERKRVTQAAISRMLAKIRAAQRRSVQWRVRGNGWRVPGSGLARTYRRGRKADAAAVQSSTTEELHEWRKQVKYLRYQFQLLESLSPKKIAKLEKKAHALTDDLGEDHDLAVLGQHIQDAHARLLDRKTRDAVLTLIRRRRRRLQKKASACGRRLYEERPKHLRRRFARWAHRHAARSAAG